MSSGKWRPFCLGLNMLSKLVIWDTMMLVRGGLCCLILIVDGYGGVISYPTETHCLRLVWAAVEPRHPENPVSDRLNAHSQTDWVIQDHAKVLSRTERPNDERSSPFDASVRIGSPWFWRCTELLFIFIVHRQVSFLCDTTRILTHAPHEPSPHQGMGSTPIESYTFLNVSVANKDVGCCSLIREY